MNNNLEKNLNAIKNYNSEITEKIKNLTAIHNQISLSETQKGEPNLNFNGVDLHSNIDAEKEAQNVFQKSEDSREKIHIIYGLGLGYLFKEFANKSIGTVVLYEPEIEILRVVFELVDFAPELMKNNVFVVNNKNELKGTLYKLIKNNTQIKLHFLTAHMKMQKPFIETFATELGKIFSIFKNNSEFERNNSLRLIQNTLVKTKDNINANKLSILENKFAGIPAVILSAGPSLAKNIEAIKDIQNKAILITVGTALKTVESAGIKSDFLVAIESFDCTAQINEIDCSNLNFIYEPYTNPAFHAKKYKNKFISISNETITNTWFKNLVNDSYQKYETKGTVSYCAMNAARIMGCNPIILIGQDLAYSDGNCYSENSPYSSLKCIYNEKTHKNEIIIDNEKEFEKAYFNDFNLFSAEQKKDITEYRLKYLNDTLIYVKGQNGDMIPSEAGYAMFIEYFKEFALEHSNEIKLINSSIGGAQIDGFKTIPLNEIGNTLEKLKPNVNDKIDKLIKSSNNKIDLEQIKINLNKQKQYCEQLKSLLDQGTTHIKNAKKEINRHKILTNQLGKYLKNIVNNYASINQNLTSKEIITKIICLKETENVENLLKKDTNWHDISEIETTIQIFENYYYNTIATTNEIIQKIEMAQNELISD